MGCQLLFEAGIVLLDFVGENWRLGHEYHLDIRRLLYVRRSQLGKHLLLLIVLAVLAHLLVVVQESLLLAHCQVHGFLAEKAQNCRGSLSRSRPPQNKEVLC